MKKRILGFVLALCLIVGLLPAIAQAEGAAAQTVTLKLTDPDSVKADAIIVEVPANSKYYAATNAEGYVESLGILDAAPAAWNIMLDNTANPAVLVLNGATVSSGDNNKTTEGNGTIDVAGEGALEVRTIADSTVNFYRATGIATHMAGGTTYTSVNNAKLSVLDAEKNTAKGGLWETVGTLTFKNANLQVESQTNAAYGTFFTVSAVSDLTIDNSTVLVSAQYSGTGAMKIAGDLLIKGNTDLAIENRGLFAAIDVAGKFVIDSSIVKIRNTTNNTAEYILSKMPELLGGVTGKTYNEKISSGWDAAIEKSGWEALNVEAGAAVGNFWRYYFVGCPHTNAGKQTDCSVAVTCPDCKATIAAAKDHTFAADDGDCSTAEKCTVCGKVGTESKAHTGGTATCTSKAVCSVCNKEYGEKAAHTPKEGTYACSEAHPCATCDGNYREAGAHVGGTATCKEKAKCTNCGAEYGELAACTPAADDGNCTTAIKCSVCGKETTAAKEHKYTNNADTSCDNAGCTHTRTVENGDKNPQTGDNTAIVLMAVLASLSAVAIIFTKKNAII